MSDLELGADLLPLPVMDETLQANEGHDVITDGAPGEQPGGEGGLAQADALFAVFSTAASEANPHALSRLEGSMLEGKTAVSERLLDPRGTVADGASSRRVVGEHERAGGALELLAALGFQGPGGGPQRRECREREGAVFFTTP